MKIIRIVTVLWFAFICAFAAHSATAQSDSVQCSTFSGDQAAAQEFFEANGQPDFLDGDGDGLACASPEDGDFSEKPTGGPSGPSAHPTECAEFNSQAEAQVYFDAQGEDYLNLDTDGNGIPCDGPGDYGQSGPSAHPSECAEFNTQPEAQTYFDAQGEDYLNLDSDGNGIACDEAGAFDLPESDSSDTTEIQSLPITGSGPQSAGGHSNGLGVLLSMSLIVGVGALSGKRLFRG